MKDTRRHMTKDRKFYLFFFFRRNILFAYALLIFLPVFFSCRHGFPDSPDYATAISGIALNASGTPEDMGMTTLDIFIFNDDALRRLDSYQRTEADMKDIIPAASRTGKKILVVVANSGKDAAEWRAVNSADALFKTMSSFADESPGRPVMCGSSRIDMGQDKECTVDMAQLLSEIRLNSIRCDFSGKPYADECLTDVRAYLINVNAEVPLFGDTDFKPTEIINASGLSSGDMERIRHPEMLLDSIGPRVGNTRIYPDICLYCYPNSSREESIGSPFTRLVIEGKISGNTFYYPININKAPGLHGGDGTGVGRNCRYVFDVTVTQSGTENPDIPADPSMIAVNMTVEPWENADEDIIDF